MLHVTLSMKKGHRKMVCGSDKFQQHSNVRRFIHRDIIVTPSLKLINFVVNAPLLFH